jgi:hypothetical protein
VGRGRTSTSKERIEMCKTGTYRFLEELLLEESVCSGTYRFLEESGNIQIPRGTSGTEVHADLHTLPTDSLLHHPVYTVTLRALTNLFFLIVSIWYDTPLSSLTLTLARQDVFSERALKVTIKPQC